MRTKAIGFIKEVDFEKRSFSLESGSREALKAMPCQYESYLSTEVRRALENQCEVQVFGSIEVNPHIHILAEKIHLRP